VFVFLDSSSDTFIRNNFKIFKFRVPSPFSPFPYVALGSAAMQFTNQGQGLTYSGQFAVDRSFQPGKSDLRLVFYGHRSHLPGIQEGSTTLQYTLPKGSPWWNKSKPSQGLWVYSDPKGLKGPVRSLTIQQPLKPTPGQKGLSKVALTAIGTGLKSLSGAQVYGVEFSLTGANLRLSSLTRGTRPPLPKKKLPPGDETEIDPHDPAPTPQ
jgi:hypothetical protein